MRCAEDEKEVAVDDEKYRALEGERKALQDVIKSIVTECNELIGRENAAAEIRDKSMRKRARNEMERQNAAVSSEQCLAVIKSYNEFMENNKKYIAEIDVDSTTFWADFELKWMDWTADSITTWFRYKTVDMDTSNVDWETVENQLRKRNITGKSLRKFSDLTFEFLEIHDFEVVQCLLFAIEVLKSPSDSKQSDSAKSRKMPKSFMCPITKKVMEDPVMAFDGHSYERAAIVEYLEQHKKSPVTGKDAEYTIVFPDHRLKAAIESFLNGKEEGDTIVEGVAETNYV